MAVHTIMLPDRMRGRELRSIVWDDEAGTVSGDHYRVVDGSIQRKLDRPKPMEVGGPWGYWKLHDPAHDPAEFLIVLRQFCGHIVYEPLRSTLPPVFDGIELRPWDIGPSLLYDGQGNLIT